MWVRNRDVGRKIVAEKIVSIRASPCVAGENNIRGHDKRNISGGLKRINRGAGGKVLVRGIVRRIVREKVSGIVRGIVKGEKVRGMDVIVRGIVRGVGVIVRGIVKGERVLYLLFFAASQARC